MQSHAFLLLIGLFAILAVPVPVAAAGDAAPGGDAWLNACSDWDDWDKPGPPYRIHGNSWYVGTCGIAAILVTGEAGHILIDGGTARGADLVAANIGALGFRLEDVKVLLQSHVHFDHVGGLGRAAAAQRRKADRLARSRPGHGQRRDRGERSAVRHARERSPRRVDAVLDDDLTVRLGALELRAIATPGHAPGALSWYWQSCDEEGCAATVYADSLSPISSDSYRFSDHPGMAAYRAGLERLAALDCTILATPHPSASAMRARLASEAGLVDAEACRDYAATVSERLDARLTEESTGG